MKAKKFKRLKLDNPTFSNTPTNLRLPFFELSLSRLPHTNTNILPQTQPSQMRQGAHSQPKTYKFNRMGTNLLSKFTSVSTRTGAENQDPSTQHYI